jgi:hypothetical protein
VEVGNRVVPRRAAVVVTTPSLPGGDPPDNASREGPAEDSGEVVPGLFRSCDDARAGREIERGRLHDGVMHPAENGSGSQGRDSTVARRRRALAALAERQYGVVSWSELRGLGFGPSTISRMVRDGTLVPVTHGVYAVGHRHLTREGWWSVAVRVGGEEALLSHRAATAARGLLRAVSTTDIIVTRQQGAGLDFIRSHRCRVDPTDRDEVHGLPVTSLARTLLDLAGSEPRRLVEALEQSLILQVYDHRDVLDILDRCKGHRGAARLRAAVAVLPDDPASFRSRRERQARDLIAGAGLPAPLVNQWIVVGAGGGHELDLYWPRLGKNAEIDGPHHDLPWQKAKDRRRDAELRARGVAVQRHRVEVLDDAPARFLADIATFVGECG